MRNKLGGLTTRLLISGATLFGGIGTTFSQEPNTMESIQDDWKAKIQATIDAGKRKEDSHGFFGFIKGQFSNAVAGSVAKEAIGYAIDPQRVRSNQQVILDIAQETLYGICKNAGVLFTKTPSPVPEPPTQTTPSPTTPPKKDSKTKVIDITPKELISAGYKLSESNLIKRLGWEFPDLITVIGNNDDFISSVRQSTYVSQSGASLETFSLAFNNAEVAQLYYTLLSTRNEKSPLKSCTLLGEKILYTSIKEPDREIGKATQKYITRLRSGKEFPTPERDISGYAFTELEKEDLGIANESRTTENAKNIKLIQGLIREGAVHPRDIRDAASWITKTKRRSVVPLSQLLKTVLIFDDEEVSRNAYLHLLRNNNYDQPPFILYAGQSLVMINVVPSKDLPPLQYLCQYSSFTNFTRRAMAPSDAVYNAREKQLPGQPMLSFASRFAPTEKMLEQAGAYLEIRSFYGPHDNVEFYVNESYSSMDRREHMSLNISRFNSPGAAEERKKQMGWNDECPQSVWRRSASFTRGPDYIWIDAGNLESVGKEINGLPIKTRDRIADYLSTNKKN